MTILIVRDYGVIVLDHAAPVSETLVDAVEQLFRKLDVRPHHDQQQHNEREDQTCTPPAS